MAIKYIIKAQKVVKRYHNHTALNKVSIKIPKGSIYGLLGPNGAGKTTLMNMLFGQSKPDKGEILFYNKPLSEEHIQKIGYLPEERGLYKKMKVGEQAMYLAQLKGMSKTEAQKKLHHWFDKFDILDWWNKKVEDLSKGMAQKIQFITTVLHDPKVLILDEPLSGLDPVNSLMIKNEILELKKKKTSIILSTHDMNSVEEICDEAAIINHSEKIMQGGIQELKEKYQENSWTIKYRGNQMSFTNAVWGGWEIISHEKINENTNKAEIRLLNQFTINQFIKGIVDHVEIVEINLKTPTIQEVFIKATANE